MTRPLVDKERPFYETKVREWEVVTDRVTLVFVWYRSMMGSIRRVRKIQDRSKDLRINCSWQSKWGEKRTSRRREGSERSKKWSAWWRSYSWKMKENALKMKEKACWNKLRRSSERKRIESKMNGTNECRQEKGKDKWRCWLTSPRI